jgi:hypothetical protein
VIESAQPATAVRLKWRPLQVTCNDKFTVPLTVIGARLPAIASAWLVW